MAVFPNVASRARRATRVIVVTALAAFVIGVTLPNVIVGDDFGF